MNKLIFAAAALGISLAIGACSVDAGIGVAGAGTPGCESLSCNEALAGGLSAQGDALCDGAADTAYTDLINCACAGGAGPCDSECADNLCVDLGESSSCGDCLNANCGPEHDTCGNN